MKKLIITFLMLFFSASSCFAQNLIGARLKSMGNNNAAVHDTWNFTGNFKNNAHTNNPTIAVGVSKHFYENELGNQSLKFLLPIKNYEFGLSFQRYGITEYNEIGAGISLAKNFGNKFSIGLRANYHQLEIKNYGNTLGLSFDAGMMYYINNELTIGLNINNLSKQSYNNSNLNIPSMMNIGVAYQASNKILIASSVSKYLNEKYNVGLGIDYRLLEILSLRGGMSIKPFKQYGGLGIDYKKFKLDLALEIDPYLGYSSQIGIAYAF